MDTLFTVSGIFKTGDNFFDFLLTSMSNKPLHENCLIQKERIRSSGGNSLLLVETPTDRRDKTILTGLLPLCILP